MNLRQLSIGAFIALMSCVSPALADGDGCPAAQDMTKTPPHQIGMYLDGYHGYGNERGLSSDKQRQIRTAHFCKQINPDMFQCVIYAGNKEDARAIGIEYVITEKLYNTLSDTEKKYWHAHEGEVDSGLLILPGLTKDKEKEVLSFIKKTYGKTWQTWNNLSDAVPLGEPALMWNVDPKKVNKETEKSVAARQVDPLY